MPAGKFNGEFNHLSDHIRNLPQYLLPQRLLTRMIYRATRVRAPWFKNRLIRAFINHFGVDMNQALQPDLLQYEHFNAFFTRAIHPGQRPVIAGEHTLCCPVDGSVSQAGAIDDDAIFQAKGRSFSLQQLLGGDAERAQPFRNGSFATLYLSPRDYHRIHMPVGGRLREMVHIPGKLFSVSPLTTRMVPNLFARNERVVTIFDTAAGPMALVLVGAINVASIETVWAGEITPPLATRICRWEYPAEGADAVILAKGAEMGRFNMGSTVIVLFAKDAVRWDAAINAGAAIRFGQKLAEVI
jgi:phosphatidylserine decarboxylase